MPPGLTHDDYVSLSALRAGLRRFQHWSDERAADAGLTPAQHQLMLAIRASEEPLSIGELAETLLLRHHSAVGLVDRAEEAGLVVRERDEAKRSVVRVRLTEHGAATLEALSRVYLAEYATLAPTMQKLWREAGAAGRRATA